MKKNLFLIGFMACGKSTIGKELASKLNYTFLDTDLLIEKKVKQTIKELILKTDEISFRVLESKVLKGITKNYQKTIIATGGGLPCSDKNLRLLKKNGILVFIDTPEKLIFNRLKDNNSRPLVANLNNSELKSFIALKLAERRLYYEKADILIDGEKNTKEIIEEINEKLKLLAPQFLF